MEINNPGSFNTTVVSNTYKDGKGIILFHDALTSIGDAAFWGAGFSSVELPNSLTTIGEQAFGANSLLETIHIPENVSSISWYRVFSQCKKLSSFTGKFATADHRALIVDGTMVGFAPAGLTEYTVDSGVKILGAVFESCFDLIRIVLPTGLEEVKGEAFEGCLGLTRIDLPSTLTSIGSFAFRDCSGLTTMDIPQSVVSIGDSVFDSCYGLGSFTGKFASEDGHYLVKGSSIIGFALAGVKEFIVPDGITATCPIDGFNNLLAISFPESIASLGQVTRCGSLASIVVNAITPPSTKLTHWWRNDPSLFYGTNSCPIYVPAQSVEAYQSADIWSSYASRIQAIPEVISPSKYLTFTSEGTTRVSLTNNLGNAPVLYYSLDKLEWTQWDYSELSFTAETPLYICGDNPKGFSSGSSKISRFTTEGDSFSVSGDIMSLLDFNNDLSVIPSSYCFNGLFSQCAGLTTAPDLPATTLTRCCYNYLFSGCSSLRIAPTLPATTLDVGCYEGMFQGCSSLTSAPALPATTMAQSCYHFMFYGCSSLTDAPELPATNLDSSCYLVMFFGCTSLTKAPELPATSLAPKCYSNMFSGCTGLTVAPQLPATTLATECYSGMFSDCSGLTEAPELPVTTLADRCYSAMFYGCSSLTTAPELPATTLTNGCYSEMFHYCENLTSAPILRAATLVDSCYESMFSRCFALNHIECLATDISATDALKEWLSAVSSTGTFVKSASMKDWPTGSSGIPNGWNVVNDGDVPNGGNEGTGEEEWN